eukprot:TRINITY_DN10706_c0_g1_i1.p1 TRINITY_DN10706_c0_g1~~TRINITY_DN10706_c0_g1_i1.p1  ORF type:complete len:439 (-),score=107.36 TRINITY_DN10706_c0_g1_i1:105-1421(-)
MTPAGAPEGSPVAAVTSEEDLDSKTERTLVSESSSHVAAASPRALAQLAASSSDQDVSHEPVSLTAEPAEGTETTDSHGGYAEEIAHDVSIARKVQCPPPKDPLTMSTECVSSVVSEAANAADETSASFAPVAAAQVGVPVATELGWPEAAEVFKPREACQLASPTPIDGVAADSAAEVKPSASTSCISGVDAAAPTAVPVAGCAGDAWPEAAEVQAPVSRCASAAGSSGTGGENAAAAASNCANEGFGLGFGSSNLNSAHGGFAPAGLRGLIAQLQAQLAEEARRREVEEDELESRAAEKAAIQAEIEAQRKRRAVAEGAAAAAEQTAREIEAEREELSRAHESVREGIGRQEEELRRLREEARVRDGDGRDWARDGPEKDALVATKLQIAEAHDQLAQLRQQLWLNREGLRRQLAELRAEHGGLQLGSKMQTPASA